MKIYTEFLPQTKRKFTQTERAKVLTATKRIISKSKVILGSGIHRVVLGDSDCTVMSNGHQYIYKVPLNRIGTLANLRESQLYKSDPTNRAKSKLIFINKVPVLIMERVINLDKERNGNGTLFKSIVYGKNFLGDCNNLIKPEFMWLFGLEDGYQVGLSRKNKVLMFDYPEFGNYMESTISRLGISHEEIKSKLKIPSWDKVRKGTLFYDGVWHYDNEYFLNQITCLTKSFR